MLRGINRSIIEINETENRYFERVLVFVRPEFGGLPAAQLEREAARLIGKMSSPPVGLKRHTTARSRAILRRKRSFALLAAALSVVAVLVTVFLAH